MVKARILMPTPFFPPAYKSGGAAKSVGNLVIALGDEYRFRVHSLSCDIDGTSLDVNPTRDIGGSTITYHQPGSFGRREASEWIDDADLLYLNGFFAPAFSLNIALARRLSGRRIPPLLVAPRGELFPAALGIKPIKKRFGLWATHAFGLYKDAMWQASTDEEAAAIEPVARSLGQRAPVIHRAADIASGVLGDTNPEFREIPRIVFYSRVVPVKNLPFAIRALAKVERPFKLDIIGPLEDPVHWVTCAGLIASLPAHHEVRQLGPLSPDKVGATLAEYDLYFVPTQSENYGHTIQEALAAGVPALISDQTPWRLTGRGAGWDLPLEEARFVDALRRFAEMSAKQRLAMRAAARRASQGTEQASALDSHRYMFDAIIARAGRRS